MIRSRCFLTGFMYTCTLRERQQIGADSELVFFCPPSLFMIGQYKQQQTTTAQLFFLSLSLHYFHPPFVQSTSFEGTEKRWRMSSFDDN